MFTFYEVGGKVRDEILGMQSKDIDYVAVPDESILKIASEPSYMFIILEQFLSSQGFDIFLSTKDCYTIRAKFPNNHEYQGIVADFVMARKEMGYVEDTRIPIIEPGTLYDDLMRRDFTVNAIAKAHDGTLIDPFGGAKDIKNKILRTPLATEVTFNDDPLRILRAIRFYVTKGFNMHPDVSHAIRSYDYKNKMGVVSEERIREELYKCFKYDTLKTLGALCDFPKLAVYIFDETKLWLKPTIEL